MINSMLLSSKSVIAIKNEGNSHKETLKLLKDQPYRLRYTPNKVELIIRHDKSNVNALKENGIKFTEILFSL